MAARDARRMWMLPRTGHPSLALCGLSDLAGVFPPPSGELQGRAGAEGSQTEEDQHHAIRQIVGAFTGRWQGRNTGQGVRGQIARVVSGRSQGRAAEAATVSTPDRTSADRAAAVLTTDGAGIGSGTRRTLGTRKRSRSRYPATRPYSSISTMIAASMPPPSAWPGGRTRYLKSLPTMNATPATASHQSSTRPRKRPERVRCERATAPG